MRKCPNCKNEITGRSDKKFCTPYCKSNFHYEQNLTKINSRYVIVDKQLKLNRKILKNFNKAGKATVRAEKILPLGFNPSIFTNYWKTAKGEVYLFCYEYGFLKKKENDHDKYVLVLWQDYMDRRL